MLNSELVAAAAAAAVIFVVFCVTHERLQSDTVWWHYQRFWLINGMNNYLLNHLFTFNTVIIFK